MRLVVVLFAVLLATACSDDSLKAEGQECFASSECDDGLTCDFGRSPATCQMTQTPRPDADISLPDAAANRIDARPPPIDAPPGAPDARPAPIDAAQPDALIPQPDAMQPDAMQPDGAITDAMTVD